eukprot:scaffold232952_cov54-Attheya_sp.AAC.2
MKNSKQDGHYGHGIGFVTDARESQSIASHTKSMANTSTGGKNNADGVPRAKRICPFCGKMGHTTIHSSSCAHNPKVIAATQDHVTSVASSTQEVPPLLPPAAQPAPPIATNDA